MKKQWNSFVRWMVAIFMLALSSSLVGAEDQQVEQPEPEAQSEETQAVQSEVDTQTGNKVDDKRKEILSEAVDAVAQTRAALKALDEGRNEEALAALEKTTGKLELIIARDPSLALAPQGVAVVTHDLFATPKAVKERVKAVENFLEDGDVQIARDMLTMLASEIRIQTTNIPLATYPDAIKAIAPLIDEGKIEEAKVALQTALNTLVVTEEIIPLPVLRAQALLAMAEKLAEDNERTIKQNDELADMLVEARNQIQLAEALGYGEKNMFKPIYKEIKEIEKKTPGGKSGTGFFDTLGPMFYSF
ncbi:YfdX family protein [Pontiellaceae bacterium B1224]|nr:YfdX family protein [Pontiellaceae bacterium B1224]